MSLSNTRDWFSGVLLKGDKILQNILTTLPTSSLGPAFEISKKYLPIAKRTLSYIFVESVAIPRVVLGQLLAFVVLRVGLILVSSLQSGWSWLTTHFTAHGRKLRRLRARMANSASYEEWCENAKEIDMLLGAHLWRYENDGNAYDEQGLRIKCDMIERLIEKGDIFNLMFKLRGGLSRHQFGVLRDGLFTKAYAGTKAQIEHYNETVVKALKMICDSPSTSQDMAQPSSSTSTEEAIPTDVKLAFFNEMRHAYGRTALMMSGGASLGYYHVGLIGALLEKGLLPRVISGSSAGSIMAAIVGTRSDEELLHMMKTGKGLKKDLVKPHDDALNSKVFQWFSGQYCDGVFKYHWRKVPKNTDMFSEDHDVGLRPPLIGCIMYGFWRYPFNPVKGLVCDSEHLDKRIKENCGGDLTFQEAFERTGRIVNITVAPDNRTDPPRLLNYLTAPHVLVRSAAFASSAAPGIFKPQKLLVKNLDGTIKALPGYYSDGSVENDLPSAQLSELFNINHFLVSQVNPHGVALSSMNSRVGFVGGADLRSSDVSIAHKAVSGLMTFLQSQLKAWGIGLLNLISSRQGTSFWELSRIQLKGLGQLVTQTYEGRSGRDISILPWNGYLSLLDSVAHIIDSPSLSQFFKIIKAGKANTWPKIPRILIHCQVEATLEECVQKLRFQLAKENAELNEQLMETIESDQSGMPTSSSKSSLMTHEEIKVKAKDEFGRILSGEANDDDDDDDEPIYLDDDDDDDDEVEEVDTRGATPILAQFSGFSVMDRTVQPLPQPLPKGGGGSRNDLRGRMKRRASVGSKSFEEQERSSSSTSSDQFEDQIPHRLSRRATITNSSSSGNQPPAMLQRRRSSKEVDSNASFQAAAGGGRMVKSTSMASFYYKRSKSQEKQLNELK